MKKVFTYIYIMCLFGCSTPEAKIVKASSPPFFDLKSFFESEIENLSGKKNIKKITSVNGKSQEKTFETLDFKKELAGFIDSDINRQSWFEKYSIDSTLNLGKVQKIVYSALSDKLKIRSIQIDFKEKEVAKVSIIQTAATALADSDIQLIYEPNIGYQISNNQNLKFGEDNAFLIKVRYD